MILIRMFMDDDSFKLNTQYIAALPWQYSGSRRVVFLCHIAKMKVSDKMEKSLSSFSAHFRFIKYTSFFALSLSLLLVLYSSRHSLAPSHRSM